MKWSHIRLCSKTPDETWCLRRNHLYMSTCMLDDGISLVTPIVQVLLILLRSGESLQHVWIELAPLTLILLASLLLCKLYLVIPLPPHAVHCELLCRRPDVTQRGLDAGDGGRQTERIFVDREAGGMQDVTTAWDVEDRCHQLRGRERQPPELALRGRRVDVAQDLHEGDVAHLAPALVFEACHTLQGVGQQRRVRRRRRRFDHSRWRQGRGTQRGLRRIGGHRPRARCRAIADAEFGCNELLEVWERLAADRPSRHEAAPLPWRHSLNTHLHSALCWHDWKFH
mmetsp:Transcript_63283/g.205414  ORF Transcript_63283/g.205414 Transcript_63283/m.205414 type:complete len:284 (-) Transcript_63283:858-1709(-)